MGRKGKKKERGRLEMNTDWEGRGWNSLRRVRGTAVKIRPKPSCQTSNNKRPKLSRNLLSETLMRISKKFIFKAKWKKSYIWELSFTLQAFSLNLHHNYN